MVHPTKQTLREEEGETGRYFKYKIAELPRDKD
jgi:hypothetical protein